MLDQRRSNNMVFWEGFTLGMIAGAIGTIVGGAMFVAIVS